MRYQGGLVAVVTNQGHTVVMGLVDEGDDNDSVIYRLGGGNHFLVRWGTSSDS